MTTTNILLLTECIAGTSYIRYSGTYRLATELRKYGYSCQVINFFTLFNFEEWKTIINKYVDENTIVVGFSITFLQLLKDDVIDKSINIYDELVNRDNILIERNRSKTYCGFKLKNFLKLLQMFKRKNNNIKFVCGGSNSWNKIAAIEYIKGYADQSFLEYIKKHDTKNIGKYNGDKFDFTRSQILWHESDHIFPKETLPIEVARGCIFKCKFCSFPENGKKNLDYIKDPIVLKEEFERNYELFGTTNYIFSDDTFNDTTYKLDMIYNKVISKLNFKINATGYIRLDLLYKNKEQIDLINEIGFHHINCGVESINYETQKYIGKPFHLEKVKEITTFIREKYPIDITTFIMFGLPYETPDTLNYMYKWIINEGLKYFTSIYAHPFHLISHDIEIYKKKEMLGYDIPRIVDGDTLPLYWTNRSGTTFEQSLKYSISVNNFMTKNNVNFSGFLKLAEKSILHIINDDVKLNKLQKLEQVINLYKQKILS